MPHVAQIRDVLTNRPALAVLPLCLSDTGKHASGRGKTSRQTSVHAPRRIRKREGQGRGASSGQPRAGSTNFELTRTLATS